MFSFMALNQSHFYKNFQGFTYCSVFKVLAAFSAATLIFYHIFGRLSTTFLTFSFFLLALERSFTSSLEASIIISKATPKVNHFFHYFSKFFLFLFVQQNRVAYPEIPTRYATPFVLFYDVFPIFITLLRFLRHCKPKFHTILPV